MAQVLARKGKKQCQTGCQKGIKGARDYMEKGRTEICSADPQAQGAKF